MKEIGSIPFVVFVNQIPTMAKMYPEKQDSKNATGQVSLKSSNWTAGQN